MGGFGCTICGSVCEIDVSVGGTDFCGECTGLAVLGTEDKAPEAAALDSPGFRKSSLTRTFPLTPVAAKVGPGPSVIANSRPRMLTTASSPFLPNTTSAPFDSCSKCNSISVSVAVGGNVPVSRIDGSVHCKARAIGLEAAINPIR